MFRQNAFLSTALRHDAHRDARPCHEPDGRDHRRDRRGSFPVGDAGCFGGRDGDGGIRGVRAGGRRSPSRDMSRAAKSLMRNVVSLTRLAHGRGRERIRDGCRCELFPRGDVRRLLYEHRCAGARRRSVSTRSISPERKAGPRAAFSALLCRQDDFMTPPDLDDCIEARGRIRDPPARTILKRGNEIQHVRGPCDHTLYRR